jgi:uncharacterized membrane protein YdjX (TVP38/TMEM64 family)
MNTANAIAVAMLLGTLGAILWLRSHLGVDVFSADGLRQALDRLGWRGPLLYMIVVAIAVVISQIPGLPLTIVAGALWGPFTACLYSVIGGTVGALIAYALGKTLGRSVMKALTGRVMIFTSDRGERYLGVLIFGSRLIPLMPFDIISYAAGVSGLSAGTYAVATFFGMIPSTLLLTYLGSSLTVDMGGGLVISGIATVALLFLPWLINRYNWFNLRGSFEFV